MVRPYSEYYLSAWSPYYEKDKLLRERVQHRFTRMIPGLKKLPYEKRLQHLGEWKLKEKRNRSDLFDHMKSRCQLDLQRFFFSQRVVDRWNGLQQSKGKGKGKHRFV